MNKSESFHGKHQVLWATLNFRTVVYVEGVVLLLGLVLLVVGARLDVAGQLDLHVSEQWHHLKLESTRSHSSCAGRHDTALDVRQKALPKQWELVP